MPRPALSSKRPPFPSVAESSWRYPRGAGDALPPSPAISPRSSNQADDPDLRRLAGLAVVQCYLGAEPSPAAFPVAARLETHYPDDADVLYQAARLHMKAWNDAVFQMFQNTPASFRVNQLSAEIFEIPEPVRRKPSPNTARPSKRIPRRSICTSAWAARSLLQSHSPEALAAAQKEFEAELTLNPSDAVAEYEIGQILLAENKTRGGRRRVSSVRSP